MKKTKVPTKVQSRASAKSGCDCSGPGGFYWGEIPPSTPIPAPRELQR